MQENRGGDGGGERELERAFLMEWNRGEP